MILSRSHVTSAVLGGLVALAFTPIAAHAGDRGLVESADRCGRFGSDFVDMGSGVCAKVTRHVRIYVRPLATPGQGAVVGWPSGGTSSAALRSDEPSMVPGVEVTQHLRVRGIPDIYSPYR